MRFRIDQSKQKEEKLESIITLKLCHDHSDDSVDVIATSEDGSEWYLISFRSDGRFFRCSGIDVKSGFKINKANQLIEQK
jgi:hypothetical protein